MDLVVVVERVAARKSPDMPASGRGLNRGLIVFIDGGAVIIGRTTYVSSWCLIFRYFYKRSLDRVSKVACGSFVHDVLELPEKHLKLVRQRREEIQCDGLQCVRSLRSISQSVHS